MRILVSVVEDRPYEEGHERGRALGAEKLRSQIRSLREDPLLQPTYGQMTDAELQKLLGERMAAVPDDGRLPELAELHPEIIERLKGMAAGAGVSLYEAALHDYLAYRRNQIHWWSIYQEPPPGEAQPSGGCSGVILVGDEIWLGKNVDSVPLQYAGPKVKGDRVVVKRPRTGYTPLPVVTEGGIAGSGGASVSTWMDEPQEDVWPYKDFPVTRFAGSVAEIADLFRRYTLYLPGRGADGFVDRNGDAISVDKSYRRVGISKARDGRIWYTEGHFQSDSMRGFLAERRTAFSQRFGIPLGSYHNEYYADCAVRFTHMGRLAEQPLDRRYEHIRAVLGDHAPFPRALCRHDGPDRADYDKSITLVSRAIDYKRRTMYERYATPDRFCCRQPETVFEFVIQGQ